MLKFKSITLLDRSHLSTKIKYRLVKINNGFYIERLFCNSSLRLYPIKELLLDSKNPQKLSINLRKSLNIALKLPELKHLALFL